MGSYVFRWPYAADDVHVTGTFDDWGKTEQLNRVGDIWEKEVQLPSADEKVLYKFVVDDQWIVDDNAPKQDDGHYNINNVLLPEQIKRRELTASAPGAFPETPANEQEFKVSPIPSTGGIGNPITLTPGEKVPDSKELTSNTIDSTVTTSKEDYEKAGQEPDQTISVNPIPASSGISNPITLVPGEKVPPTSDFNRNTIDSAATTSREDYEKAGQEPEQTFSVNPVPASSGDSNPITLAPGQEIPPTSEFNPNTIGSGVTTSKDDYDKIGQPEEPMFSVNPIPASSGISNPITLAPGEKVPPTSEFNPNTVDSAVTTSREDYENAGKSSSPAAAIGAAGGAGIGAVAAASAFSKPEGKKNIIPESSLPMDATENNTLDSGPFISSAAPTSTTAQLAADVPLEKTDSSLFISSVAPSSTTADLAANVPLEQEKLSPFISSAGPETTTANLAAGVPLEQKSRDPTISSVGSGSTTVGLAAGAPLETKFQDPTISSVAPGSTTATLAAGVPRDQKRQGMIIDPSVAPAEAVQEKAALEKELLSKVQPSEAAGESASAAAQQSSYYGLATEVPKPVEESMLKAHVSPEAAADRSVVAEKAAVEQELLGKVHSTDEAGEPAPTIAAATSSTAPTSTTTADVTKLTDGTTANQAVPDTDTSTAARGATTGEIAGGAVIGSTAAAGLATAAARHKNADVEPPRVEDTQKPSITTESAPAAIKDKTVTDSALANEPAVKLMTQNDAGESAAVIGDTTTNGTAKAAAVAAGVPTVTNTGTIDTTEAKKAETPASKVVTSAPSTPAKKTTETSAANSPASTAATDKKKKRHRISAFIEKIKNKVH